MPLQPGDTIGGDFRIVRPISSGGMGSVFEAEQVSTGRRRALKVMLPELVGDAKLRDRFRQEAKVGSMIESDHVVEVLAAGVDADRGVPYIVMELLEGETLAERVERGPIEAAETLEVCRQLFHAMGAAHAQGIVHRDLKPQNVFLARTQQVGVSFSVKVLDFGIARIIADVETLRTQSVGTPLWMSPEQTETDGRVTQASDVWALGLVVFYMLAGVEYWRSASSGGRLRDLLHEVLAEPLDGASERAAELEGAALPEGFDEVFRHAVARDPAQRYADARAMFAALEPVLHRAAVASTPGDGETVRDRALLAKTVAASPLQLRSGGEPQKGKGKRRKPRQAGEIVDTAPMAVESKRAEGATAIETRQAAARAKVLYLSGGALVAIALVAWLVNRDAEPERKVSGSAPAPSAQPAPVTLEIPTVRLRAEPAVTASAGSYRAALQAATARASEAYLRVTAASGHCTSVTIDSRDLGRAPFLAIVDAGRHEVVCKTASGGSETRSINVAMQATESVSFGP